METIEIERININDRRFCISYPLRDEALLSSIKKVGIIQPALLLNTTPYVAVTGFKRIASAMQLGLTEIPSITLDISEKDALLYSIHDNMKRGLNIIEKAHSVERMLHTGFFLTEIHETMALLSLNPHEKIIERLVAIANAEDALKDFAVKKTLSMKNIENLIRLSADERARIIDILAPIHTTESFIREILEMLNIVKIKKGSIDFDSIADVSEARVLRKWLKKLISPMLSSLEERLREIKSRCSLPPDIDIRVDPFFEKGYIDILIRAKTQEEVKDAIEKLDSILEKGYVRSIFELTKG